MVPGQHESWWIASTEPTAYPTLPAGIDTDVVVLGAGIAGITTAALDPAIMGYGPVLAAGKLMEKLSISMDQIDLVEANEAFAAQSLAVRKDLGLDPEKTNVNGGAIALGHPIGASGCRILITLLYEMQRRDSHYGLATLCIGGGMGTSVIVER